MALTDTAIRNAKPKDKPYKVADSGGLYLLINPRGSKLWRIKYRMHGVERKLALGAYPEITLAEARTARDAARRQLAHAVDPNTAKRQARVEASMRAANSFAAVAEDLIAKREKERDAARQLMASRNRVAALQGSAGTAKTSTVLTTIARAAEERGLEVTALAPTAAAAQLLGEALDTRADTLARHLLAPGKPTTAERLWIVDEASLVSARDMAKLVTLAESHRARLLLVGDTAQLGSVEAGAAFAQLQAAGMETAHLTQILRQTNEAAKAAVEASLAGDANAALAALDSGGGQVIEANTRGERFARIASDYASLDVKERRKALVIEPSREGRDALTRQIRHELAERGQLTGPAITATRLVAKDMTRAEAKDARSYDIGDTVRFAKDYADKGIGKTEAYRVTGIDAGKAAVKLAAQDGREIDWRLKQWGASHAQAFRAEEIELRAGDRLQITRNDRALARVNGHQGEIIAVDPEQGRAALRLANGRTAMLDLANPRDQHIAHGYVATAFAAQGRTAEHAFIHADSAATNLVDQKAFYVALSRAREATHLYTDDRVRLTSAIRERSGQKQMAVDHAPAADAKPVASHDAATRSAKAIAASGTGLQ